ncbi:MAG TPA: heparinase II/III family protein [Candidatus Avipropionibacterium avicola]|uniref:Heparinase II/III family protein n=1 Tax=Candidatus Avipropionibacterium avicola TaxID=2840701 RepID=A0A9D1KP09_9ACTN|nr:heparinase II/III family protein [Candidatus Avipropionibacterium avicola]
MSEAVELGGVAFPRERGGWWHEYVCAIHGTELLHEGLTGGRFPTDGVRCPHGCRWDTPAVRGAWVVLAHQAYATRLVELAESDDTDAHDEAATVLTAYAQFRAGLPSGHDGAQAWMTSGRLFHQALTEAIWAVRIATAAWALRGRGRELEPQVDGLLRDLADDARRSRDLLVTQGKSRSNYVAWLNAAGAVCSHDPEWLTGPYGMFEHLLEATLPDGWHWEATTYYHSFVLRAALVAIGSMPEVAVPEAVQERLSAMRRVLVQTMTPSGVLPALSDGPYRRDGYTAELAELALEPDPDQAAIVVQPDGGRVVIRHAGIHALVNFGPHGESHGHADTGSLLLHGAAPDVVSDWQPDPGQVPYAHRAWRRHYASTAAHPSVSVDGEDQHPCQGVLEEVTDEHVRIRCDTAWPGVWFERSLSLRADGLLDEVTVHCDRPRRIGLHLRPAVDLVVTADEGGFTTRWAGGQVLHGHHHSSTASELLTRPWPGPADDPQRQVTAVDWVAETDVVTFTSLYRVGSDG